MEKPTLLVKGHIKESPEFVPIHYIINAIGQAKKNAENILILKSSTGSGKSTILPVYIYATDLRKKVLVIEPKIFSVLSLAKRIASQEPLEETIPKFRMGENIGYHTGQYFRVPPQGIVYITFGSFIRFFENESDDDLRKNYSAIIVDEAHDMELFSTYIYKKLRNFIRRNKGRPDCPTVIFTSATLDGPRFSKYFDNARLIEITGHHHTVTDHYLEQDAPNFIEALGELILNIHSKNENDAPTSKDILVFLPGVQEIEYFINSFLKREGDPRLKKNLMLIPLYRKLIMKNDQKTVAVHSSAAELKVDRKVILATNVGETGITYINLKYVIDVGQFKSVEYMYDFNAIIIYNKIINRLSYEQRRGRVGRTSDGEYYGLYSKETFNLIKDSVSNQMFKDDISYNILYLLNDDDRVDLLNLDLLYNPAPTAIWRSLEKLFILGFINPNLSVTPLGIMAAKFKGLSIEQIKLILSGYVWKAPILDLITIAVSLNFILKYVKKSSFSYECECDLIPIVELLHNGELIDLLGDEYENFIDIRDSVIDTLATNGLDPFHNYEKCYPNNESNYFKIIKQCLYEAFKLNSAYWDGSKHITQSGNELFLNLTCHVNNFIYTDLFISKRGDKIVKSPARISVLDNFVNYTPDLF